jgi:hypothetical protein
LTRSNPFPILDAVKKDEYDWIFLVLYNSKVANRQRWKWLMNAFYILVSEGGTKIELGQGADGTEKF